MSAVQRATVLAAAAFLVTAGGTAVFAQTQSKMKKMSADEQRGQYLVRIGGCNDCHTPEYPEKNGIVDQKLWLTGSILGWRGPWGTTYPSNLRLLVQNMDETAFVKHVRSPLRPPMPWFNLRDMSEKDVRAIYRFIKYLGPAGQLAPEYVPPDKEPKPPFVQFPAPPPSK
jgi:mono/diheme cytochrome c family protein